MANAKRYIAVDLGAESGRVMLGTLGLALVAGALSTLSPCVLPLVPIVLGAAASEHRLGPVALISGVTFRLYDSAVLFVRVSRVMHPSRVPLQFRKSARNA